MAWHAGQGMPSSNWTPAKARRRTRILSIGEAVMYQSTPFCGTESTGFVFVLEALRPDEVVSVILALEQRQILHFQTADGQPLSCTVFKPDDCDVVQFN